MIRLLTSIEQFQTAEKISLHLRLPASRVQGILDFLSTRGLCVESRGRYKRSEKNTHIAADSPLAIRHHQKRIGETKRFLDGLGSPASGDATQGLKILEQKFGIC